MKSNHNGQNFKVLLGLSIGVLMLHLALLSTAPVSLNFGTAAPVKPFVTRTLVVSSSALPPNAARPTPLVKSAPVRPRPVKTTSIPLSTPSSLAESPAIAVEEPTALAAPAAPAPAPAAPAPAPAAPAPATPAPEAPAALPEAQAAESAATSTATAVPRTERELATKTGAVRLPGSALVKYKVEANRFPFGANGELLWQQDGQAYKARLSFSAFGQTRMQTSQGQITPEGLAPIRFADKYRSEVAAHFDRARGLVTFSANTPNAPLLAGAQDRLSVILQLAALIAEKPAQFTAATTVTIQVVGARDADTWLFTLGEEETLSLAGGEQRALKLVRNPRLAFDQKVELWLGTQLDYLPVRLKITEANGDFIDQKWLSTQAPP